jgi:hypothetical protein
MCHASCVMRKIYERTTCNLQLTLGLTPFLPYHDILVTIDGLLRR